MLVKPNYAENYASIMDLFPNEQIFYLDKSRQKFHHSLKEHHRISNIPKFRCEMLYNADNIALRSLAFFSHFVLCIDQFETSTSPRAYPGDLTSSLLQGVGNLTF
jgi:hypothetical protein